MLEHIIIESERLKLRPITMEDTQAIFKCFTPEVTHFMYPKAAETIEDTKAFVRGALRGLVRGEHLQLVMTDKSTDEFYGCIGLHHCDTPTPEIGIWLKKEAHRKGYGLEAANALIDWACKHYTLEYIRYPVDRRNKASRRIPEYNGATYLEGEKIMSLGGVELDIINYMIPVR